MTIKLAQIINPEFQKAVLALTAQPLPAVLAYRLGKVLKIFNEELAAFEEARQASIKAHTAPESLDIEGDKAPGSFDQAACVADIEVLLQKTVDINFGARIVLTDKIAMTPQQLLLLDDFIDPSTDPAFTPEPKPANVIPLP